MISHVERFYSVNLVRKSIDKSNNVLFFTIDRSLQLNMNLNNNNSEGRKEKLNLLNENFKYYFQKEIKMREGQIENKGK